MADKDDEIAVAAAAGAGAHHVSPWARHGREAILGSHELTAPLARWAPELAEPQQLDIPPGDLEPEIAIPEAVLHVRKPQRLPEDAVCRSPIAGLVIAVLAAAGESIKRGQPVMIVEAMKMENNVSPEVDGVLKAVHVSAGDPVKAGQVLFELE